MRSSVLGSIPDLAKNCRQEESLEIFRRMCMIRYFEIEVAKASEKGHIYCPVYLSIGQESIASAVSMVMKGSYIFTQHRGHSAYLAFGGDPVKLMDELLGLPSGCCGGMGGSPCIQDPNIKMIGHEGLIGEHIPIAVGMALGAPGEKVACFFGDGAVDEGVYHESINFASLHELPIIFLCENNGLAVHSSIEARQAFKIIEHVSVYGISTTYCPEGYDLMKVHEVFSGIVDDFRKDRLPHFIEIKTFRYVEHVGHGEDYDDGYRSRDELEAWRSKDPLVLNKELVDKFTPVIIKDIDDAVEFAETSPWPGREDLLSEVI